MVPPAIVCQLAADDPAEPGVGDIGRDGVPLRGVVLQQWVMRDLAEELARWGRDCSVLKVRLKDREVWIINRDVDQIGFSVISHTRILAVDLKRRSRLRLIEQGVFEWHNEDGLGIRR